MISVQRRAGSLVSCSVLSVIISAGLQHAAPAQIVAGDQSTTSNATTTQPAPSQTPQAISADELNRLIGGPTLITLHHKNALPQAIIADLVKQAKVGEIDLNLAPSRQKTPVTVDIERQPFWVAIKTLVPKLGFYLEEDLDTKEIILETGGDSQFMKGPSVLSGPCVVVVEHIRRTPVATPRPKGQGARPKQGKQPQGKQSPVKSPAMKQEHLDMRLSAFVDPKLMVTPTLPRLTVGEIAVVDAQGNSLQPSGKVITQPYTYIQTRLASGFVHVPNLPGTAKRITKFKGEMRFLAITKSERWEVPNLMQAKNLSKQGGPNGNWRFTVVGVGKDKYADAIVKLEITRPEVSLPPLDSDNPEKWDALMEEQQARDPFQLQLFDAVQVIHRGNKPGATTTNPHGSGSKINFSQSFNYLNGKGTPNKLIWEIPTEYKEVVVPFEFSNLAVP